MEKTILNFHFDYLHTSLRSQIKYVFPLWIWTYALSRVLRISGPFLNMERSFSGATSPWETMRRSWRLCTVFPSLIFTDTQDVGSSNRSMFHEGKIIQKARGVCFCKCGCVWLFSCLHVLDVFLNWSLSDSYGFRCLSHIQWTTLRFSVEALFMAWFLQVGLFFSCSFVSLFCWSPLLGRMLLRKAVQFIFVCHSCRLTGCPQASAFFHQLFSHIIILNPPSCLDISRINSPKHFVLTFPFPVEHSRQQMK